MTKFNKPVSWGDDELLIVHPETGEERFLVTDRETIDLRLQSHEHLFDKRNRCLICDRPQKEIEDTQNAADSHPPAD